jgi:hypothetical protein
MRSILTSYGDEWLPIRSPGILRRDNSHVVRPSIAYLVSEGVYGEYRVLGVFTEHRGAQDFADHHKLGSGRYSADNKAQVEEVDLYGPGWRRPPSEVGDGEIMDRRCGWSRMRQPPSARSRWMGGCRTSGPTRSGCARPFPPRQHGAL